MLPAVLLAGICLSVAGYVLVAGLEDAAHESAVSATVRDVLAEAQREVDRHLAAMQGLVLLFDAPNHESLMIFRQRTRGYESSYPGFRFFGWVPRISHWERKAKEEMVRLEGISGFLISERGADQSLIRAARRETHFPVLYALPEDDRGGVDLGAHPESRAALDTASQLRMPVTALYDPYSCRARSPQAVLIVWPAAREKGQRGLPAGFAVASLDVGRLLQGLPHRHEGVQLEVVAGDQQTRGAARHASRTLRIADFDVPVACISAQGMPTTVPSGRPESVLAGGLALTATIGAGLRLLGRGQALLARRTQELATAKEDLVAYIQARKRMEDALRQSEERYRSLGVASSQIIWTTDAKGEVTDDLLGWRAFTGQAPEAVRGDGWLDAVHPDDRERAKAAWREAAQSGEIFDDEFRVRNFGGEYRHFSVRGVPVRSDEGSIREWVGSCTDITERKAVEDATRRAREAAEAASRLKGEFLANMSHEIRTPMNAILGMTELALETRLTPEQGEYLGAVHASAQALLRIINDILDFSKIEAGKLHLEKIEFRMRETVAQTLRTLAVRAHGQGLELLADIPPELPDRYIGDPDRLRQVLLNLVGNAIKFTRQGEVVLGVRTEGMGADTAHVRFFVRDTGIGIPEEKRNHVFAAFAQADGSTTRRYGGTGLGLTISSQLVRLMGGRIWVESAVQKGSMFQFTARFDRAAGEEPPAAPAGVDGKRVLLAAANATLRGVLENLLGAWGTRVTAAADCISARALLDGASAFDLLVLDTHGAEAAAWPLLKGLGRSAPATVLLLDTRDQHNAIRRAHEVGAAAWLVKPVRETELARALQRALGQMQRDETVPAPLSPDATRSLRILVAEDTPVNQRLALRLLERLGHTVVVVSNGAEAVEAHAAGSFDAIFMDVQMPGMGGFEATAAIRARERETGVRTPIIALTAHAMQGYRERCIEAGMDDYLSKPIRRPDLAAALERVAATSASGAAGGDPS